MNSKLRPDQQLQYGGWNGVKLAILYGWNVLSRAPKTKNWEGLVGGLSGKILAGMAKEQALLSLYLKLKSRRWRFN